MSKFVLVLLLAASATAAQQRRDILKLVGQIATVCGDVVTFSDPDDAVPGCNIRLDIGSPYWDPRFYLLVPASARAAFDVPPEDKFFRQQVCVTGLVRERSGVPHIVVERPEQVQIHVGRSVEPFGKGVSRGCEAGATEPVPTREVRPEYSRALLMQKAEGTVLLEAVIDSTGVVGDVRTLYSAIEDFERMAAAALRKWRFKPGTVNGVAVPMIVQVEMTFRLR